MELFLVVRRGLIQISLDITLGLRGNSLIAPRAPICSIFVQYLAHEIFAHLDWNAYLLKRFVFVSFWVVSPIKRPT